VNARPLKVLIVDDEPPIRKLLRMGLGSQGYEMLDAPNGKTALALLDSKPDLVILDLGLPDIGGLDLLTMRRTRSTMRSPDRNAGRSPCTASRWRSAVRMRARSSSIPNGLVR